MFLYCFYNSSKNAPFSVAIYYKKEQVLNLFFQNSPLCESVLFKLNHSFVKNFFVNLKTVLGKCID